MAHSYSLRSGRRSIVGQAYHLRFVTADRVPYFTELYFARAVICSMRAESLCGRIHTHCFVVMPDHLHWLCTLQRGSISQSVANVKRHSRRRVDGLITWQDGFFDRALHRDESLRETALYILNNPVRAGLVASLGDYAHWDAEWLAAGEGVL